MLITLAAYAPAFRAGFIWDDFQYLHENPVVQDPAGLKRIWGDVRAQAQFYPLTFSTFWIEYQLWGLSPMGYHAVNVVLHAANALLVWAVLRRLAVPGAWLAAALFAVHPVHVESVAWIVERKNVLSGLFYLLAALAYLRFSGLTGRPWAERRWGWYWLSLTLFAAALLSKTVVCTLPAAILLVLWWKHDRLAWQDVWPLLPMAAMGAAMALLTGWVEKNVTCATEPLAVLPLGERLLITGRSMWFYLGKLAWPSGLCLIYPRWEIDTQAARQYLFPVAAAAAVAILWLARGRIGKGPLTALLFYAGTSLPTLGMVNLAYQRFSFVADHFQYLANIAPLAAASAVLVRLLGREGGARSKEAPYAKPPAESSVPFRAVAAVVLIVLVVLTCRQGRLYKDEVTIWTHSLEVNPATAKGWYNLAYALAEQNKPLEAIAAYEKTLSLGPGETSAHVNISSLLIGQRRIDEAVRHAEEAIRAAPTLAEAYVNLAQCRQLQGRRDEAIEATRRGIHAAQAAGRADLASQLRKRLQALSSGQVPSSGGGGK